MRLKEIHFQRFARLLLLPLLLAIAAISSFAWSQSGESAVGNAQVLLSALPVEAADTLALIKRGGPYPYSRDGIVFSNYEKRLPNEKRGYYHEYTVKTPGARNRGARRIVCGQQLVCYYTDDHYRSFRLILE